MPPSRARSPSVITSRKRKASDDASSSHLRSRNLSLQLDDSYKKDMYLLFVRNALKEKASGNSSEFDQLVGRFSPNNLENLQGSAEPKLWLNALTHVVSSLERVHSPLVHALIDLPWIIMEDEFVRSYMGFIAMLVSARPEYLGSVLSKIVVHGFTYRDDADIQDPGSSTSTPDNVRLLGYERAHILLQRLIALIPTLSSTLEPIVLRSFPHKRRVLESHAAFVNNVLRLADYCPELSDRILAAVVDHTIQIDVEIQVELEDLDEEELERTELLAANLAPAPDDDDFTDSDSGSDSGDEEQTTAKQVAETIKKLDAILKIVFTHLNRSNWPSLPSSSSDTDSDPATPTHTVPPHLQADPLLRRRSEFLALLTIFDRTILRTFKSRYTQFLIFWYSSLDPEFWDLFLGFLVSKSLFEESQPAVTRAAAASYVASFVSRALFVERDAARRTVGLLCQYLESQLSYADEVVAQAGGAELTVPAVHFNVFYAVTQAVLLVFCFRWRDLLNTDDEVGDDMDGFHTTSGSGKKWMVELDVVQKAIASPLNPLKFCSQNVVKQFARISQSVGFVYCYGVIENNKRAEWAALTGLNGKLGLLSPTTPIKSRLKISVDQAMEADLNSFFPFDPYNLPQSQSYVESVYRDWSMVALDDEEGDSEEEDEDDGDNVELADASDEEIGRSFNEMSISPVRHMSLVR